MKSSCTDVCAIVLVRILVCVVGSAERLLES